MSNCYCGSANSYAQCCERLHKGVAANSPEALMRSRYSAFVLHNAEYLLKSWHSSTRPQTLELNTEDSWLTLSVLSSDSHAQSGRVHFKAYLKEENEFYELEENSTFILENGHWYYVDGTPSFKKIIPQRNDPCPCNSGRKFKKCCSG